MAATVTPGARERIIENLIRFGYGTRKQPQGHETTEAVAVAAGAEAIAPESPEHGER